MTKWEGGRGAGYHTPTPHIPPHTALRQAPALAIIGENDAVIRP